MSGDTLFDLDDRGASHTPFGGEGRPAPTPASTRGSPDARRQSAPRSLDSARAERDEAMAAVEDHAGEDWNTYARAWLQDYLSTHASFFPDDVWEAGLTEPSEARAFGPVVKYAAARGWIVKDGGFRQRTRGHATVAPTWRSLIFRGRIA